MMTRIGMCLDTLLLPTGAQAQQGANEMSIARRADMKTVDGPAEYFTGKATTTGQFQRDEPSRVSGTSFTSNQVRVLFGTPTPPVRQ